MFDLTIKSLMLSFVFGGFSLTANADEFFVTIHRVSGNQIAVVRADSGGQGGGEMRRGRGRRGSAAQQAETVVMTLANDTKITTAMRERRTSEFRVGAEIAGGLKHSIFTEMQQPLQARIVSDGQRITELNVITTSTDINQSNTGASGQPVIAVRPKRPPMKRK
jgi:hypothetical protein